MFLLTSILKYVWWTRSPLGDAMESYGGFETEHGQCRNMLNLAKALNFQILWFEFQCLFTPLSRL